MRLLLLLHLSFYANNNHKKTVLSTFSRQQLQHLCKKNGVKANMKNIEMVYPLVVLPMVDGFEKIYAIGGTTAQEGVLFMWAWVTVHVGLTHEQCHLVFFRFNLY